MCFVGLSAVIAQQKQKVFSLASPNGKVALSVVVGNKIAWSEKNSQSKDKGKAWVQGKMLYFKSGKAGIFKSEGK